MRYACLVYADPKIVFDNSPESNAVLEEAGAYARLLNEKGVPNGALTLPEEAVTVRVRDRRMRRTDGPFVETKEILAAMC